jgi:peptide/nickel transport system ATP-binding protein
VTDLLDVRGLSVRVRGGPVVVENVSFSLGRGRRLGIVGGSGSGKSVTIHAIAGLLAEELTPSGSVRLEGVELLDLPEVARARLRGRRIATVFQEPMTALDPTRRIGDQVRAALDIHGLGPARERQAKALDLLAAVGLPPSRFSPRLFPHELSGGQRQRVLLAAALSAEPDLLLADEPTTALDLVTQRQILRLLDDLVEQRGVALVLVSHDLAVIARMCSHVLVMDQGRIVETGPVDDVLAKRAGPSRNAMATHVQHQGADAADLLSVRNVSRRYRLPDGSWRRAVEEVDLRIAQGEALGLSARRAAASRPWRAS